MQQLPIHELLQTLNICEAVHNSDLYSEQKRNYWFGYEQGIIRALNSQGLYPVFSGTEYVAIRDRYGVDATEA